MADGGDMAVDPYTAQHGPGVTTYNNSIQHLTIFIAAPIHHGEAVNDEQQQNTRDKTYQLCHIVQSLSLPYQ